MSHFKILRAEEGTNLVINPSIELVTTGWTAVGGTVARSSSAQRRGLYSLAVDPTTGVNDGCYFGTVSLTSGYPYTFSVDVLGVYGVPYRIYFGTTGGVVKGTPTTFNGTGDWQRVTV
ncbi:MAG: carbohydrate binding domain-containing protein, partial [Opitutaceae bacterium]